LKLELKRKNTELRVLRLDGNGPVGVGGVETRMAAGIVEKRGRTKREKKNI